MKKELKLKCGEVRMRGTLSFKPGQELMFQSNAGVGAMQELERLNKQPDADYIYMLIINDNEPQTSSG
jgi:hypothetical protein